MALARYEGVVTDKAGNVVPLATLEVRRDQPGRPIVPLFADRAGTVALGNPLQADALGAFAFHLPGGVYRIRAYTGPSANPTFEVIKRYQAVGTAGERDVEELAATLNAGIVPFATEAALALFAPDPEAVVAARVFADPDGAKNGDYLWETDEWVRQRGLPDTAAVLTVTGGDANDIEATYAPGVDPGVVRMAFIEPSLTNTGEVTINGKIVRNVDGLALVPGEFPAGRMLLLTERVAEWRILTAPDLSFTEQAVRLVAADVANDKSVASAAAVAAENAAATAATNANVYGSTALGLAGVSEAGQFQVLSGDDYVRYRDDSGVATEVGRFPSAAGVERAALNAYRQGLWQFYGDGDPDEIPTEVTPDGKVLASIYRDGGRPVTLETDDAVLDTYRSLLWRWVGDGDPETLPQEVTSDGKLLVGISRTTGALVTSGSDTDYAGLAYLEGGDIRVIGGTGADRLLVDRPDITWRALTALPYSALLVGEYADDRRELLRASYKTGKLYRDGVIILWTDDGQSNAEGQAQESAAALRPVYPWSARLRMPNAGVWAGMTTQGGASLEFDPADLASLVPLRDEIAPTGTHGTTAAASAAYQYFLEAADACGGWTPRMVVFSNAEGGQTIERLLSDPPDSGYYAMANIEAILTRIAEIAEDEGTRAEYRMIFMAQGESDAGDALLGQKHNTYRTQVEALAQSILGQTEPVRMISSQASSFFTDSSHVRSIGEFARVNRTPFGAFHCLGPTYCYPWASDFLHHTSLGHQMRGEDLQSAALAIENEGAWVPLEMVAAAVTATNTITVTWSEAAQIATSAVVEAITNSGVVVPGKTVSAVNISGTAMTITTAEPAAGATVVQVALAGHSGTRTQATIPRSNIRSVASHGTYSHDGSPKHKWARHQEISL